MTTPNQILSALSSTLNLFFADDTVLLSQEARYILNHPTDKQKYKYAINALKHPHIKSATISLHTGYKITLIK